MQTRTAPRQVRSARSVGLILDAAERVLQDRGVVETSTIDVAAAAGVSVGRLYYWFPDKDAIVRAVLARSEQRLSAFLVELIADDPEQTAAEIIDRVLPVIGKFFRDHPGSLAVLQRGPVGDDDPGQPLCQVFVQLIAKVIESRIPGIDQAERDVVANTVVRIVIAMLAEHVRSDEPQASAYLNELDYVVALYLRSRFPAATA